LQLPLNTLMVFDITALDQPLVFKLSRSYQADKVNDNDCSHSCLMKNLDVFTPGNSGMKVRECFVFHGERLAEGLMHVIIR